MNKNFFLKFDVRRVGLKDIEELSEFVFNYYTKRNPLGQIFRVKESELWRHDVARMKTELAHNCSLGFYEKNEGKLGAVAFSKIIDKSNELTKQTCGKPTNCWPELIAMKTFDAWMRRDICKTLNTNKFMMRGFAAVHTNFAGYGISAQAIRALEALAFQNGCDYTVGLLTSRYSQDINKKFLGYKVLRDLNYSEYFDPNTGLKPDLDLSSPHMKAQLTVCCLK